MPQQRTRIFETDAYIGKAVDDDDSYEFVMSSSSVDRMGDIVDAASWKLATFRRNPIALFAHDSRWPIGSWSSVKVVGDKLIGTLHLARKGTSRLIDELHSLIEQGIMRAVSVGFIPGDYEPRKNAEGYLLRDCELLECSLVSIPANADALIMARSLDIPPDVRSVLFAASGTETGRRAKALALLGDTASNPVPPPRPPRLARARARFNIRG